MPAAKHLFEINNKAKPLTEVQGDVFHTFVAKGLFLTKRARLDIHMAVAFLSTRVKNPDKDNWKKLQMMICCLCKTLNLCLTLQADSTNIMKFWIDELHLVFHDYRGHTGSATSLGHGSFDNASTKQKVNTQSSTVLELVAVDDRMTQILWTKNFLHAQDYTVQNTIIYQDNKSAILLENNGRLSTSKRTKHLEC